MKDMKKILMAALVLAGVSFSACSLDEYNPREVSGDDIMATYAGIYGMEAQIYKPIYDELFSVFDFLQMAEGGTDAWWNQKNSDGYGEITYYESLVPFLNKGWDKAFNQMYAGLGLCNTIIHRAPDVTDGNEKDLAIMVGEARFMRGFYHLLLTTYYGPITLLLEESSDNINYAPKRNTLSEIYTSVIEDFKAAAAVLEDTPFENNSARATKPAALGMLARAYAQGAGQGLTENGVSYWQRAKEVAEDMIAKYGASRMYSRVDDLWADANNRGNKEFLFRAAGPDSTTPDSTNWNSASNGRSKNWIQFFFKLQEFSEFNGVPNDNQNYLYGRVNGNVWGPSKYLVETFNPTWDTRWENSFTVAFGAQSFMTTTWSSYLQYAVGAWKQEHVDKFGIDPAVVGKHVFPYGDCIMEKPGGVGQTNQFTAKVWPKGIGSQWFKETEAEWIKYQADSAAYNKAKKEYDEKKEAGTLGEDEEEPKAPLCPDITVNPEDKDRVYDKAIVDAMLAKLETPKKVFVTEWPLDPADDRFYLYLYHPVEAANFDRTGRAYICVSIDDLFVDGEHYPATAEEMKALKDKTSPVWQCVPSLNKFAWNFDGVFTGNLQIRNGDYPIMRMAEMYLIAAEANVMLGDGGKAAEHLNVLRERAVREGYTGSWRLASATMDDVFDEYARELCGEFQRWPLLQRHNAFKERLAKYNPRAAKSYTDHHIWRPISQQFLNTIDNKEEYGDNGYGTTAKSGLEGFLE